MPDRFGLAESWQADRGGARERAEVGGGSVFVEIDAGGSGRADFEEQRLLEHQRAVAGEGRRVVGAAGVHFGTPAGGVERGHASTSFSAAAKARSEERRVGTECGRTCTSWWSPNHEKKKQ